MKRPLILRLATSGLLALTLAVSAGLPRAHAQHAIRHAAQLNDTDIVLVSSVDAIDPALLTDETLTALGEHLHNTDGQGNAAALPVILLGSTSSKEMDDLLDDVWNSGAEKIILLGLRPVDRDTLISSAQNDYTLSINDDPGTIGSADDIISAIDDAKDFTPDKETHEYSDLTRTDPTDKQFDKAPVPPIKNVVLSGGVDLSKYLPPVQNQGGESSCVGWSTSYYYKTMQEAKKRHWDPKSRAHQFSPSFVYNQINGGKDDGAQIYDAMQLIVSKGDASLADFPYNDGEFRTKPAPSILTNAGSYKAQKYFKFYSHSEDGQDPPFKKGVDIKKLKQWLAGGDGFVTGLMVSDSLQNYVGGIFDPNPVKETKLSGHAMMVVGYSDNAEGTGIGAFKVVNSWGADWGENGYVWMSYRYFAAFSDDAYAMVPR